MTERPRARADRSLWQRLATVQDAALADPAGGSVAHVGGGGARGDRARSRPRRQKLLAGKLLLATTTLCAVVLALALALRRAAPPQSWEAGRIIDAADEGRPIFTDARSDLPLRFVDGSTITFRADSAGRLQRLTGSGAEVMLERGRLDAHVVHGRSTLWLVHAGAFRVRVTGTRFAVIWSAAHGLDVVVHEGSVMIEGGSLGAGVPLSAGHRLTIVRGVVRTEAGPGGGDAKASDQRNAPPPAQSAPPAAASPHGLAPEPDWFALAQRGAYRQARAVASGLGWDVLCRESDARRLLMLGDVARHADAADDARRAFESLVTRFPHSRLTADAVFSLGRLAFEADRPTEAARWFQRYVDDWPRGPMGDQASGRLLECALRRGDTAAARAAAVAYLARAPQGSHASLANEVLRRQPATAGSP